ncbi:hypothetical protein CPB86DRAFT_788311 [Serendipita vermifera]|nr:hypothetical protein CPB86DRAFT_788311 [Serendipita vermifera]
MSTRSGKQPQKSSQNKPKKSRKRQERNSSASDEHKGELFTTGNSTKRRRRDSYKEDLGYKGSPDSEESGTTKEVDAIRKELELANTDLAQLANGKFQILPILPNLYFRALKENDYDRQSIIREQIENALKAKLQGVEQISGTTELVEEVADSIRGTLQQFQRDWKAFIEKIYKPMAPSYFAKSAGWVVAQKGPAAINCLRPPDRSGLPISLLHPAFAEFIATIKRPMPPTDDCAKATEVAWKLCLSMPEHFEDEQARQESFHTIMKGLLPELPKLTETKFGSARPDGVIFDQDLAVKVVAEIKNEPGAMGDVYMQASCSYHLVANTRPVEEQKKTGCPALVLCIDGPNILFCGGFRDGDRSVVEPFAERETRLAHHLYAFMLSVRTLFKNSSLPGTTMGCPRIYNCFRTLDGQSRAFTFNSHYKPNTTQYNLLFKAILEDSTEALVKVVPGSYGVAAHQIMGEQGFAPKLYGVAELEGAPPAYVMEFLSEHQGWVNFQEAKLHLKNEQQWAMLRTKTEEFLLCMKNNQLVHGDLRPNNMLIRVHDEGVDLRVLDWDWAGKHFEVRYPLDMNPAAGLPGDPGEWIQPQHDSSNLAKYLKSAKQSPIR